MTNNKPDPQILPVLNSTLAFAFGMVVATVLWAVGLWLGGQP